MEGVQGRVKHNMFIKQTTIDPLYCPPPSACHTDYLSDNKADIDAIRFVSDTNPTTTINVCSCGRAGSADGNG